MLAQNFKTPAELGIAADEFEAAVRVLAMLERGELVYVPYGSDDGDKVRGFNMGCWQSLKDKDECGTWGCIGGWIQTILGHKISDGMNYSFADLFFPPEYYDSERYTVEAAAQAMRAKLTTGKADWSLTSA